MDENKILSILEKVYKASVKRNIEWEKNPKSESSYKAELGTNTIYVINSKTDYYFVIVNATGDQIGSLTGFPHDLMIEKLYELAKSKALRIDENLDDIDSLLEKLL